MGRCIQTRVHQGFWRSLSKLNSSLRKWQSGLKAYCSACLADFEVPKLIHLVSAIPKNAMGKVRRHDLTALFS
jgi:acyl-coenzyme A synthetase/AMP-(fatty) acid ligase